MAVVRSHFERALLVASMAKDSESDKQQMPNEELQWLLAKAVSCHRAAC